MSAGVKHPDHARRGATVNVMLSASLLSQSHRLLNQARMIAEAPAAQTTQIGHTHPDSRMPPGLAFSQSGSLHGTGISTLQQFGARINLAISHDSDSELAAANEWCTGELDSLRHAATRGAETGEEFRVRIVAQYPGVLAGVVARAEMTSVTTVRKLRSQAGCDPRTGHELG